MGSRAARRPAAALLLTLGAAAWLGASVGACRGSNDDVAARRTSLAKSAAHRVAAELSHGLARAREALDALGAALDAAGARDAERFDALQAVKDASGVDGLAWEGPGGEVAWAGRALEVTPLPAPPPWNASFRAGDVTWHDGPFLRGLVVGPVSVRGGFALATVLVEERRPTDVTRAFERRWLVPLGVESIEISHPSRSAPPEHAEDVGTARVLVESPAGTPALLVLATAPGPDAVADHEASASAGRTGILLLLLLVVGVVVATRSILRRVPDPTCRAVAVALLALLVRWALKAIDLPLRFPFLRPAFQSSDFGVDTLLGWLASPADFALTALAGVVAAAALGRASRALPRPKRTGLRLAAFAGGLLVAAGAGVGWVEMVDLAADAQTPYFAPSSFIPALPAALLLGALVATTAAAWLTARAALRAASKAAPAVRPWLLRLVLLAVPAALAWVAAEQVEGRWAALLIPGIAALLLRFGESALRPPNPARILLLAVLATALLFPLLWARVGERRAIDLSTTLEGLLRRESAATLAARADLDAMSRDPWLRQALLRVEAGEPSGGIAFHLWLTSFLSGPGEHGIVTVLDRGERLLEQFSLMPLPTRRVPHPVFPAAGAGDLEVIRARGDRGTLRSVVGRLRVREPGESGEPARTLGGVVLTVPDPLDLEIAGLGALTEGGIGLANSADVGRFPLQVAVVENGAVVASNDPSVSHRRGGFGPPEIARLGPSAREVSWRGGGEEGHAVWSEDRGAVIAVRRRTADSGDLLLALARLVVVGVGLGALVALGAFLVSVPAFRPRLHHKILLSYFAISVVPLALLGWATAAEARSRYEAALSQRLERDLGRVRSDLEEMGPLRFDSARDANLTLWALQRGHDVLLYRDGLVEASSRTGLVQAELLPRRLPAEAYRATALDRRETIRREASFAGRAVWFGYAPVLDDRDRAVAVIGVPLLYDKDRIEEELAVTGSALLAAYLLTLVLVLVGGIYAASRIARPIDLLSSGTKRVAEGALEVVLPGEGKDELGQLVAAFNQMTRDLRLAAEQAARSERESAWRRMARQVAHEIKNPLTPMRLMIQQMLADVARDPTRASEAVGRTSAVVLRQIEALGRIAGDFAQFARTPRRAFKDVDVPALLEEVVHLYSGSVGHGVRVVADAPRDLPRVRWDEEELRRVLVNLVGNAVQSIRGEGRVEVSARALAREGRAGIGIDVRDTGVGIPRENLERLFEPGFSTRTSGTGLGLAIVRGILDDMGGDVSVESETGRGSTFRIWWPLTPPESPPPP